MPQKMSLKRLATYLKTLRPGGKPSLLAIAQRVGLHESFLAKLEAGAYKTVSVDTLKKVAEAYGVPFATLLREAGYVDIERPGIPELGTYLRTHIGLNEAGVKEVESFIEFAKQKYGKRRPVR